jgi:hypothetical protein
MHISNGVADRRSAWASYLQSRVSEYVDTHCAYVKVDPADLGALRSLDATNNARMRMLASFVESTYLTHCGAPVKALLSGERSALYWVVGNWLRWVLADADEPPTVGDLVAFSVQFDTPATAARIVPRLRAAGLVTTQPGPGSRKHVLPSRTCVRNGAVSHITWNMNMLTASRALQSNDYLATWSKASPEAKQLLDECVARYQHLFG